MVGETIKIRSKISHEDFEVETILELSSKVISKNELMILGDVAQATSCNTAANLIQLGEFLEGEEPEMPEEMGGDGPNWLRN